jgi:hypothetical protein
MSVHDHAARTPEPDAARHRPATHHAPAQSAAGAVNAAPGALLLARTRAGRGNGAVQVALVQRMQQTYGNRAVRRFLQTAARPAPMAPRNVQRYETYEHVKFGGPQDASHIITIKGVKMTEGEIISMGDFFAKPEDIYNADPKQLQDLVDKIRKDVATSGKVTNAEWEKATGGRYTDLAEKNETHFGPSNAALFPVAAHSGGNHLSEFSTHHRNAIKLALEGKKDEALATNAFGDHFLTDAFSAGHLVNKEDLMSKFKGDLGPVSESFFDRVAAAVWADQSVADFVSKYETVKWEGYIFRPNINSASRFSALLQGIYKERPDVLLGAVAKVVHDDLNSMPGGIPVQNAKGDTWQLSGDGTLNAKSLEIGQRAVAQSRQNVLDAFDKCIPLDPIKSVWDFTPVPTAEGLKIIQKAIAKDTNPKEQTVVKQVAAIIRDNIHTIIEKLVEMKKLKVA